ncbi:MAG: phosphatidate cytidylyltransferase [Saprospiraceae bacterium]|nr:phosphatidate cytidylyltransferase [Saprospiraceae bacterium]
MSKRIITGLTLGIIMISSLLIHKISAVALLTLVAILSCMEWKEHFLTHRSSKSTFLIISIFLLAIGIVLTDFSELNKFEFIIIAFCLASIAQIVLYIFTITKNQSTKVFTNVISGILYIILPSLAGIYFLIENFERNKFILLSFIIINWANDSMAYFGGKLYGKKPLAPKISPKKTIEGSLTGLTFGVIAFIICNESFELEINLVYSILIGLFVVIAGSLGDLFESSLKRSVQIKDSGKLLPGHGGFLDRFDSFYFVLPVGIFLNYLFNYYL